MGKNYAYNRYDYATGITGEAFDAEKPLNESRNNTGLKELPAVAPPFIWYPYDASVDFPQVGTGGRNAMAGPVYYTDMWPAKTRLPDYYNGKLFIYDWIRGWIKVVTMLPDGDFDEMEPFMEHTKWHNAIDMEVGPDGRLYVLEYGSGWFAKNEDAGLSRIDYNGGNRPPKIAAIKVDKTSGALPLTLKATVTATDPENDAMTYTWTTGSGQAKETQSPEVELTLDKPGDYGIAVEVKDKKGAVSKSNTINVYAGNTAPEVTVQIFGNQSFYFPGKPVNYAVTVNDKEEGSAIDADHLYVTADYLEGADKAAIPQGHQTAAATVSGRSIMLSLDCKTCHKTDEKSIGPSFTEVAKRYHKNGDAVPYLTDKIIKGGSGAWGEVAMAAHPGLAADDAKQIVHWILTLANPATIKKSLPEKGSIPVTAAKENEALFISATYTDKGGASIKPLLGEAAFALRSSKLTFGGVTRMEGYSAVSLNGMRYMVVPAGKQGWFSIDSIDLEGVSGAELVARWQGNDAAPKAGYIFELRLGAPDGQKLAEAVLDGTSVKNKQNSAVLKFNFDVITGGKKQNLYIISSPKDKNESSTIGLGMLELMAK